MMDRVVGFKVICALLGVSGNQAYMWHQRRKTNGFPDHIAEVCIPRHPGDKRGAPLFDLDAVVDWWATYDPSANKGAHWKRKRDERARQKT